MKFFTNNLQTLTTFYHWTPHHLTDRHHYFFYPEEPFHCCTNTIFLTLFMDNQKPMNTNWDGPTMDFPVQFYANGNKDLLNGKIYQPPPHRIPHKLLMCSCWPHVFWFTTFVAISLVSLLCCPFAPFSTMLKAKSKTTAHAKRTDHAAARIHRHYSKVSLKDELEQIAATEVAKQSKTKKQSKAGAAIKAQKGQAQADPCSQGTHEGKRLLPWWFHREVPFLQRCPTCCFYPRNIKTQKVHHNSTTLDRKSSSLNPKTMDFTPVTSPPCLDYSLAKQRFQPSVWMSFFTLCYHSSTNI